MSPTDDVVGASVQRTPYTLQLNGSNRIRYRFTPAHCSPKLHADLKGDYDRVEKEREKIVVHTIHLA